jgi:hypothetical protein
MEKLTKHRRIVGREEIPLGESIHREIRETIEQAVEEELEAVLGHSRTSEREASRLPQRQPRTNVDATHGAHGADGTAGTMNLAAESGCSGWKLLYGEDHTAEEKNKTIRSLPQVIDRSGFQGRGEMGRDHRRPWEPDHILGPRAAGSHETKKNRDPSFSKRKMTTVSWTA